MIICIVESYNRKFLEKYLRNSKCKETKIKAGTSRDILKHNSHLSGRLDKINKDQAKVKFRIEPLGNHSRNKKNRKIQYINRLLA